MALHWNTCCLISSSSNAATFVDLTLLVLLHRLIPILACISPRVQQQQQCLTLNTERFAIPELLFHPTDVGVNEIGVVDAIVHAIAASPAGEASTYLSQPVAFSSACTALEEHHVNRREYDVRGLRIEDVSLHCPPYLPPHCRENELRSMAPDLFTVNVRCVDDPITAAWTSAAKVAASNDLDRLVVSRAEYEEGGDALCRRRFFRDQCFSEEMLDRT
jgi:actin-related protein 6